MIKTMRLILSTICYCNTRAHIANLSRPPVFKHPPVLSQTFKRSLFSTRPAAD